MQPSVADSPELSPAPTAKKSSWYKRLYLRVEAYSATRYALVAMLLVSVVDGSIFPIPPFALLVPMVLAQPKQWWRLAVMGTVASLLGGLIGYYLGMQIHDAAATFGVDMAAPLKGRVADTLGVSGHSVGELLGKNFWFLALMCSVLPTPFKVVAIGSGIVQVDLARFMIAAVIGRSARFFGVAGAIAFAGPRARKWLRV